MATNKNFIVKNGLDISGRATATSDNFGLITQLLTTAGYGGVRVNNQAGIRKLELITVGSTAAAVYGASAGDSVINANTGNLVLSTADVARVTIDSAGILTNTNAFRSLGQLRATGWFGTNSSDVLGPAAEVGVSESSAFVVGYNRTVGAYIPVVLQGSATMVEARTGAISFQTSGAERMSITNTGALAFGGASGYGTSGQILTSSGNSVPTWSNVPSDSTKVSKSGDTIMGSLGIGIAPTDVLHVAVSGQSRAATFETTTSTTAAIMLKNTGSSATPTQLLSVNNDMAIQTGGSTRLTITSVGNVGVGTTTPTNLGTNFKIIDVRGSASGGAFLYAGDAEVQSRFGFSATEGGTTVESLGAEPITFYTNGAERFRVTPGGRIGINGNTTGISGNLQHRMALQYPGGGAEYGFALKSMADTTTAMTFVNAADGTSGSITTTASTVSYNTSSDARLKENIVPAGSFGAIIDAIEVVSHDWKVGGHVRAGVIAQDLNVIAPEAVNAGDANAQIQKTWGVDYSKLVPMLIKEIQELRQRLAAAGL